MTRLPRDVNGDVLVKRLRRLGYEVVRQHGSHVTCTTQINGEHHAYVPQLTPLPVGTLHAILKDVAQHHGLEVDELPRLLKL